MNREMPDRAVAHLPEWETTRAIIDCFYKVYNGLGYGFLESVYRRALEQELLRAGLTVAREVAVEVFYQRQSVGMFRLDLLVEHRVAVELKATPVLGHTDRRQLLNYLRATSLDVGLLLHFGPQPKFHRIVSPRIMQTMGE